MSNPEVIAHVESIVPIKITSHDLMISGRSGVIRATESYVSVIDLLASLSARVYDKKKFKKLKKDAEELEKKWYDNDNKFWLKYIQHKYLSLKTTDRISMVKIHRLQSFLQEKQLKKHFKNLDTAMITWLSNVLKANILGAISSGNSSPSSSPAISTRAIEPPVMRKQQSSQEMRVEPAEGSRSHSQTTNGLYGEMPDPEKLNASPYASLNAVTNTELEAMEYALSKLDKNTVTSTKIAEMKEAKNMIEFFEQRKDKYLDEEQKKEMDALISEVMTSLLKK